MDLCRLSLLLFILGDFCLDALGKALKSCRSRSSRCHPVTTSETPEDFRCPGKGHFEVASDVFSFYKCAGPEYQPCLCSCKNEQMCFDATRRRCRFAFMDSVRNCSRNAAAEVEDRRHSGPSSKDTEEPVVGGRGKAHKDSRVVGLNEVLKDKSTTHVPPMGGVSDGDRSGSSEASITDRPLTDAEALAARHAGQKRPPDIIEDNSLFPAWAISLLVLCVVIALVLVVMVLY